MPAYPILRKDSVQIIDRANAIWVISKDSVVLRRAATEPLEEAIGKVSPESSELLLIKPVIEASLVDREGTVWLGAPGAVHRFSHSPLVRMQLPAAPAPWFMLAPDDAGVVWISAGDGVGTSALYRVTQGKVDLQRSTAGVSSFVYRAPDKALWFGGEGGLWRMADGRLAKVELPKELAEGARFFTTMTHDGSGGFWVGGYGLHHLKDGAWTKYERRDPRPEGTKRSCPETAVLSMFTDRASRVWLGCWKGQLTVLEAGQERNFGPKDGLEVGSVMAIHGRGSEMWIGGEFGLQQFDRGRFHTIRAIGDESLRGIVGIVETANGDLWLNGLGGIVHIRREEILKSLRDPAYQVTVERFDRRAGLPGLPSQLRHLPTAIESTDGRLWFAVNNGVVSLDPARASNRTPSPSVSIQSVTADGKVYEMDQRPEFPAGTSNIQISYAAVSLLNPEATRFRYRLRGMEDEWHEAGRATSVSYRNLVPGSYRLEVDASDANGNWSGKTATTQFTILPAYYQTDWFRALCAGLFLAMLWMAYRLRVRHLQRRFEMTLLAEEKLREKDDALEMARTELARVSRLTTLGELTTSIAHEVSQPLGAMVASAGACARWLAADPPAMAEARSALDNIVADGKRAREVIARIRALTKRQAPRMDLLDLNREILEVLALTEQELRSHDIVLETKLDSTLPQVMGDRVQLQQVLLNLILNAIEAMSAVNNRPRELTIVSAQDTGGVVVEVRDSGIGLDQDRAERVFDAFYTTKAEGLGIGLSISRSIVEAHGGRLWAAPNQPHGAVFRFSLPAAENGAIMSERAVVFVVDDDPSMRRSLEALLRSVGLDVRLFSSAQEFMQAERPDAPGCLVLDVRLPGMSGLTFQQELAKAGVALPVIFITGHGDVPMTVRAMKAGAAEFLTKPFDDQVLLDAIHAAIERDRARRRDAASLAVLNARYHELTERERQVMKLVVAGRVNKQIAAELGLSLVTVKVHRGQVMRKMLAKSVAELVRMADRLGVPGAA